jgi:2,4-dienoyl-CoA reductase-like NADH-dependent reductase (Old Yellow Enzyme family)
MNSPVFEPVKLGSLQLSNRLILAPMTTYSGDPDGQLSREEEAYLVAKGQAGYGAIMTAACYVHPSGKAFPGQWGCDHEGRFDSLHRAAHAIKRGGAKAILQIHHGGRQCSPATVAEAWNHFPEPNGTFPLDRAVVATPHESDRFPSQALTTEQAESIVAAFADSARRAVEAGFDGVEIHGANTYLLQQFVSPLTNRREDTFGHHRLLFSRLVTQAILDAVPTGYPIGYRFSPEEPSDPGIDLEQTKALLRELCHFPLAFLHISLQNFDQMSIREESKDVRVIDEVLNAIAGQIPLIGVGGVSKVEQAESCLELGASAVAIGRAGICDPQLPQKFRDRKPANKFFPRENGVELLKIPTGLHTRIVGAPGWFEPEPETNG